MATSSLHDWGCTVATDTRAFLAGRDLACEVLKARHTFLNDTATIEAQYRDGRPQVNWMLPFIERLCSRPVLCEGFAAVLSDFLSDCGGTDVEVYERLTPRQIFGRKGASQEVRHG